MKTERKAALVLGAVKGIGKAIALDLLRSGTRVAATWFDWPESLAAMQTTLVPAPRSTGCTR